MITVRRDPTSATSPTIVNSSIRLSPSAGLKLTYNRAPSGENANPNSPRSPTVDRSPLTSTNAALTVPDTGSTLRTVPPRSATNNNPEPCRDTRSDGDTTTATSSNANATADNDPTVTGGRVTGGAGTGAVRGGAAGAVVGVTVVFGALPGVFG